MRRFLLCILALLVLTTACTRQKELASEPEPSPEPTAEPAPVPAAAPEPVGAEPAPVVEGDFPVRLAV